MWSVTPVEAMELAARIKAIGPDGTERFKELRSTDRSKTLQTPQTSIRGTRYQMVDGGIWEIEERPPTALLPRRFMVLFDGIEDASFVSLEEAKDWVRRHRQPSDTVSVLGALDIDAMRLNQGGKPLAYGRVRLMMTSPQGFEQTVSVHRTLAEAKRKMKELEKQGIGPLFILESSDAFGEGTDMKRYREPYPRDQVAMILEELGVADSLSKADEITSGGEVMADAAMIAEASGMQVSAVMMAVDRMMAMKPMMATEARKFQDEPPAAEEMPEAPEAPKDLEQDLMKRIEVLETTLDELKKLAGMIDEAAEEAPDEEEEMPDEEPASPPPGEEPESPLAATESREAPARFDEALAKRDAEIARLRSEIDGGKEHVALTEIAARLRRGNYSFAEEDLPEIFAGVLLDDDAREKRYRAYVRGLAQTPGWEGLEDQEREGGVLSAYAHDPHAMDQARAIVAAYQTDEWIQKFVPLETILRHKVPGGRWKATNGTSKEN